MAGKLLLIELLIFAVLGALLAIAPVLTSRVLGFPRPTPTLWPRLFGTTLVGLAAAIGLTGILTPHPLAQTGLGLAGMLTVNLALTFAIVSILMVGAPQPTRRARLVLWLLALTLFAIAVVGAPWAN